MRRIGPWFIGAAAIVLGTAAAPAWALDLTGTWEGKIKCTFLEAGESIDKTSEPVEVAITQTGDDLAIDLFGFGAVGRVLEDATDPAKGMASMVVCGSSDTTGFIASVGQVKVDAEGGGIFKGSLTFDTSGGLGSILASCSINLKRTDTADPLVPAC
jgi:hypothetical protein